MHLVVLLLPQQMFFGHLRGLLGTWDGDVRNEFQTRDGSRTEFLREHTVVSGDTLRNIAPRFGVEWKDIWNLNKGKFINAAKTRRFTNEDLIFPGERLILPCALLGVAWCSRRGRWLTRTSPCGLWIGAGQKRTLDTAGARPNLNEITRVGLTWRVQPSDATHIPPSRRRRLATAAEEAWVTACLTLGGAACDQGAHTAAFPSPEKEAAGQAACLAAGLSDDPNSDTYTHYLDCIFDMIGSDVNLAFIDDYGIVALTQQEEDREVATNGFVPVGFTLEGLPCDDAAQCNGHGACTDPSSAAAGCVCDAGWAGFNWYVAAAPDSMLVPNPWHPAHNRS